MPLDEPKPIPAQKHEADGVREKPAAIIAISVAAGVLVILVCVWLQFKWSEGARYHGLARAVLAGPQSQPSKPMPEPKLEITSGEELAQLRAREDAELNNYAWLDRTNNVVQIPIERAMELISQRGLPAGGPAKSEYELILERSRDRALSPMKEAK